MSTEEYILKLVQFEREIQRIRWEQTPDDLIKGARAFLEAVDVSGSGLYESPTGWPWPNDQWLGVEPETIRLLKAAAFIQARLEILASTNQLDQAAIDSRYQYEDFYNLILEIGDRSGDGHSQLERKYIRVNRTPDQIVKAYKEACEKTKIDFGVIFRSESWGQWSNYEDQLQEFGFDLEYHEENQCYLEFFFQFVKIVDPDIIWEENEEDRSAYIDVGCPLGYGLFFE